MSDRITNKALSALREYKMLEGISHVTVALSGGADSMSLLHFLIRNKTQLGITVSAAHLNHNIRGSEAKRDEDFVRLECEKLGVDIDIRSVDIILLAKERRIGHEECGRQERYAFFESLREKYSNSVTATAHTASDNAETVLMNITRGCGIDGLCGIPPIRSGIIRPLIYCTRADIEEYCKEYDIPYITDSTNLSDEYSRNRVRLNVLPQLELINPSVQTAINRLSALAQKDSQLIKRIAASEMEKCRQEDGLSIEVLRKQDAALLPHIILSYLSEHTDITLERKHLDIIMNNIEQGHGGVEIRKGQYILIANNKLIYANTTINITTKVSANIPIISEIPFSSGLNFDHNGKHYSISEKITVKFQYDYKINKKLLINRLSCGIISCDTVIRTRRSGDVFTQAGRGCTKTVKKLFSELKLPAQERSTRLLIASGSEVLWIEGIGASQKALPKDEEPFFEIKAGC